MSARPDRPAAPSAGSGRRTAAHRPVPVSFSVPAAAIVAIVAAALAASAPLHPARGQEPSVLTVDPRPIGRGAVELSWGAEYAEKPDTDYLEDAPGRFAPVELTRILPFSVRAGISSNADVIVSWRGRLSASDATGRRMEDWGDPSIFTKITFTDSASPASAGALFGFKIPSSRYLPARLGSDAMDGWILATAGRRWERVELRINAGLGILGDPLHTGSQDDVLTGSAYASVEPPAAPALFAEVHGFTGPKEDDDKLQLRGGLSVGTPVGTVTAYGFCQAAGDESDFGTAFVATASWGFGASLTHRFRF